MAHRFVEHVGEVEIDLEGASEADVFAAALAAFAELVAGSDASRPAAHDIELVAADHALLLVDWLSELVYLAEVKGFVPDCLEMFELAGSRLRATVTGRRNDPRHLVKAVTLNKLELRQEGEAWHGRVVLDV